MQITGIYMTALLGYLLCSDCSIRVSFHANIVIQCLIKQILYLLNNAHPSSIVFMIMMHGDDWHEWCDDWHE